MNGNEFLAAWEVPLRLVAFFGVLGAMAFWELKAPRRVLALPRWQRWPGNLGIVALDALLVRLLIPVAGAGMAMLAATQGWGLFNQVPVSFWLAVLLSVVLLDLAIYVQHVVFHAVPALWRVHRMHHADLDFDVTTGARFHPIEIALSMLIKLGMIVALGVPAMAAVLFEILLNATSMFNHGNVRLPAAVDRVLRFLIVTPDMHRVHHSIKRREIDSNFGFNLSLWDRLFGTYRAQPEGGHEGMTLGIPDFRHPRDCATLPSMLAIPFRSRRGDSLPPLGPLKDKSLAVCRTDKRSAQAAELLRREGFRHLQVLLGGMEQWNRQGFPIARQANPNPTGNLHGQDAHHP